MQHSNLKAAVLNDLQFPYVDQDACDIAAQIVRDYKPDVLTLNGDIFDLLNLSRFPNVKTDLNEKMAIEFESEIDRGVAFIKGLIKTTRAPRVQWLNGNHENRVLRAVAEAGPAAKKILELKIVRDAYSYQSLFRFSEFGVPVTFAGEYPHGLWLHPTLPPDRNVWIEHGTTARKNSGYTVHGVQQDRMSSVLVGHCHRASLSWRHVNGDRDFFAIENAGLSLLGVPGKGEGMYFGAHHSVPDYMNTTQGFSLITYSDGHWYPELVRIKNGTCFWHRKTYKSRLKA